MQLDAPGGRGEQLLPESWWTWSSLVTAGNTSLSRLPPSWNPWSVCCQQPTAHVNTFLLFVAINQATWIRACWVYYMFSDVPFIALESGPASTDASLTEREAKWSTAQQPGSNASVNNLSVLLNWKPGELIPAEKPIWISWDYPPLRARYKLLPAAVKSLIWQASQFHFIRTWLWCWKN